MPTLRSLSKTLETFFTAKEQVELPQNVLDATVEYAEGFSFDATEAQRLHEELLSVHKLVKEPKYQVPFLEILNHLVPCLMHIDQYKEWFRIFITPALVSAGQLNVYVTASRDFLITVMVHDYEIDGEKIRQVHKNAARQYCLWILDIYIGASEWFPQKQKVLSVDDEERDRFTKMNAKYLLLRYGNSKGRDFMTLVNEKMKVSSHRVASLVLLSVYVSGQPRQLFEIQNTPLLESIFNCLKFDLSSTALTICATVLAMTLPHICNDIVAKLPKILALYGRLACWRLVSQQEYDIDHGKMTEEGNDTKEDSSDPRKPEPNEVGWDTLGHHFNIQDERKPQITPLFTFLYGLFPSNLLSFLRKPSKYLDKRGFEQDITDFWDDHEILVISKPMFELHLLNPSLVSNTAEEELHDVGRFEMIGSATDIASYCLSLYNQTKFDTQGAPQMPQFDLPFAEAPTLFDNEIPLHSYIIDRADYSLKDGSNAAPPARTSSTSAASPELAAQKVVSTPTERMTTQSSLEKLLAEHGKLYTRGDIREDANSPVSEISLTNIQPDDPISTRKRSSTLSSPGFLPIAGRSPTLTPVSSSQVSSPRVESKPVLGQIQTVSEGLENEDSRVAELKNIIVQQEEQINYLNREVMIQKNELDFVTFIEKHSQYKYKQMRNELSRKNVADESVRHMMQRNNELRKKLEKLRAELDKAHGYTRTYKNERKKYEEVIMSKSNEYRKKVTEVTDKMSSLLTTMEEVNRGKEELQTAMQSQEVKITELELKLAEALDKSKYVDSYKKMAKQNDELAEKIEEQRILSDPEQYLTVSQSNELRRERDELKVERDALLSELESMQTTSSRALDDAKVRIAQLEAKKNDPESTKRIQAHIQAMQQAEASKYTELRAAHEDLTKRYTDLDRRLREIIAVEEAQDLRALHEPKKSILGYDIDDSLSEAASVHSAFSDYGRYDTSPRLGPVGGHKKNGELRVRGRLHESTSQPPSRKSSGKQGGFRGLRM